jgi:hypothetical protein
VFGGVLSVKFNAPPLTALHPAEMAKAELPPALAKASNAKPPSNNFFKVAPG